MATTILAGPAKPTGKAINLTDWNTFRKLQTHMSEPTVQEILDNKAWMDILQKKVKQGTKAISEEANMQVAHAKFLQFY